MNGISYDVAFMNLPRHSYSQVGQEARSLNWNFTDNKNKNNQV